MRIKKGIFLHACLISLLFVSARARTSNDLLHSVDNEPEFQFGSSEGGDEDDLESETDYDSLGCIISDEDASESPWLGWIRIFNNSEAEQPQRDAYWPVVVIGPSTVLTGARAFRSPYSVRKLNIHRLDMYHVHLGKGSVTTNVSFIHINPNISVCAEHWMQTDNEFALIHLSEPLNFTKVLRPLCLPSWNESWWEDTAEIGDFIQPRELTIVSGWICNYHSALRQSNALFGLEVISGEKCSSVWRDQADYSEEEGSETKYKNRICGSPTLEWRTVGTTTIVDEDELENGGILCVDKFYYSIQTLSNKERVLLGIFSGIAQEIYAGPTAYVLLLKPSILEWINASMECGPDMFACDNGDCIEKNLLCDEKTQCADGSDEISLICEAMDEVFDDTPDCRLPEPEPGSGYLYVYMGIALVATAISVGVFSFALQKFRETSRHSSNYLSDQEIRGFRQGMTTSGVWVDDNSVQELTGVGDSCSETGDGEVNLNSLQMPFIYNLEKHQIRRLEEIGGGAFGVVYKGVVEGKTVAVKVLKRDIVNKEMFKTFLVELKIMAFVNFIKGGHENVIRLIGAYTAEIRDFELYIVVEYCRFGSIADYLRENRSKFRIDASENPAGRESPPDTYVAASSLQPSFGIWYLHSWTLQIVDGMHFLATHNIIHGDLAVRNVLLDHNFTAKISDFGLSRQIYCYTSCARVRGNAVLPWRWMAPEVIGAMKISSKSDVWSFGITLWELYELGSVPYGELEWNPYFVEQLKCGLRLQRPQYANYALFRIIQDCWAFVAEERPDFGVLRDMLSSLSWSDLDLELFRHDND